MNRYAVSVVGIVVIMLGSFLVLLTRDQKERIVFTSAVDTMMNEAFNEIYPDPTISYLGSQSPDYKKTLDRQSEFKKVFMSGDERFLERKSTTPYELSDAAAKGRFARFKAMCRVKPQQNCPD